MHFVQSGQEALSCLERDSFDVVVSDIRMPGMDGAQLLTEVMRRHPQIVRIVLSGHSDQDLALRSVKAAHQYLSKPCDSETLKSVIIRTCSLRDLLAEDSIRQLVSKMTSLPSLPSLYHEILDQLQSRDVSVQKVGEIVSKDLGMTAKILQLVNSAFFGLPRHISNPTQAVSLLGLDVVRVLVLSIRILEQFDPEKMSPLNLEILWQHSLRTGLLARTIAKMENQKQHSLDESFTAGLLHDLGKPILSKNFPEGYQEIEKATRERKLSSWEAEKELWGATHSEVGAYLLGLWGLPDPIIEAVAFHHFPSRREGMGFSPLLAVHIANVLEHQSNASEGQPLSQVDLQYLSGLQMTDRLNRWAETCPETLEPGGT